MLARRGKLTHEDLKEELPMLVPSFSSKGSPSILGRDGVPRFEVAGDLRDFRHRPARSVLVSAFDLHYGYLERLLKPPDAKDEDDSHNPLDALAQATLVFLDSGGYELSDSSDSCEPKVAKALTHGRAPYDLAAYVRIVEALDSDHRLLRLVITNFDHSSKGLPFDEQVAASRQLFKRFPRHLHSHIIKPEGAKRIVNPDDLSDGQLQMLRGFHVVGVTEHELGANLIDRLRHIATLRRKLDGVGITAPIHVWGGLDPVITPLYFFAGAQMFDGVSWLRYGYQAGMACSRASFQILEADLGLEHNRVYVRGAMSLKNLGALIRLEQALLKWVDKGGTAFGMFDEAVGERLEQSYQTMKANIEGV